MGIQGYYDTPMDHAQNMVIWPDDYQVMDRFLAGIPEDIQDEVFKCGLSPEVNSINDIVLCARAIEICKKTVAHYCRKGTTTISVPSGVAPCCTNMEPRKKQATYTHCPRFETKSKEVKDEEPHCCTF